MNSKELIKRLIAIMRMNESDNFTNENILALIQKIRKEGVCNE